MSRQRIILHAGFHKTGTTTIQSCLHQNGPLIWPTTAIGLAWRFKPLLQAARGFSTWRDPFTLEKFAVRLAGFLTELDLPPHRQLVLSAEELAGHMPGRTQVPDYSALPILMATAVGVMQRQFPNGLDLTVFLSTRDGDAWLDSAWAEHVKSSRMTLDLPSFRKQFAAASDLGAVVDRVKQAIAPFPVTTCALEDSRHLPLGPAEPLIDLLNLPSLARQQIKPANSQNARVPAVALQQLLALNRSDLDADALWAAKKQILSTAWAP